MGRIVRNWKPIRADEVEVAPHRYLWSGTIGADGETLADVALADDWKAARKCIPYAEGEVVYITSGGKAARALIYSVLLGRDSMGFRQEHYLVQPETAAGTFSKLWEKAYPGFVQRGYQRAGLAPDMPAGS